VNLERFREDRGAEVDITAHASRDFVRVRIALIGGGANSSSDAAILIAPPEPPPFSSINSMPARFKCPSATIPATNRVGAINLHALSEAGWDSPALIRSVAA
jgi:hypothetical protein